MEQDTWQSISTSWTWEAVENNPAVESPGQHGQVLGKTSSGAGSRHGSLQV